MQQCYCWLFSMSNYGVPLLFCQRQHGVCWIASVTGMFPASSEGHLALFAVEGCPQQTLQSQITLEDWSTTCWTSSVFLAAVYFSQHKALLVFPVSCLQTGLKFYLLKNCITTALCNRLDLQHTKPIWCLKAQCAASLTLIHYNFTFTIKYQ